MSFKSLIWAFCLVYPCIISFIRADDLSLEVQRTLYKLSNSLSALELLANLEDDSPLELTENSNINLSDLRVIYDFLVELDSTELKEAQKLHPRFSAFSHALLRNIDLETGQINEIDYINDLLTQYKQQRDINMEEQRTPGVLHHLDSWKLVEALACPRALEESNENIINLIEAASRDYHDMVWTQFVGLETILEAVELIERKAEYFGSVPTRLLLQSVPPDSLDGLDVDELQENYRRALKEVGYQLYCD